MTTQTIPIMGFFRGATSYEWWIGRLYGRWCFLRGGDWGGLFDLTRFSFGWDNDN